MPDFAPSITRLIDELKRLPGIGQKTAQRLAFYLLRVDRGQALALSDAIREAKSGKGAEKPVKQVELEALEAQITNMETTIKDLRAAKLRSDLRASVLLEGVRSIVRKSRRVRHEGS